MGCGCGADVPDGLLPAPEVRECRGPIVSTAPLRRCGEAQRKHGEYAGAMLPGVVQGGAVLHRPQGVCAVEDTPRGRGKGLERT
jgi:hypothetical protein